MEQACLQPRLFAIANMERDGSKMNASYSGSSSAASGISAGAYSLNETSEGRTLPRLLYGIPVVSVIASLKASIGMAAGALAIGIASPDVLLMEAMPGCFIPFARIVMPDPPEVSFCRKATAE